MANEAQKAVLVAKIAGVLKDLMIKTTADQVYIDSTTTLASKLAEVISTLNGKASTSHKHNQSDINGLSDALNNRPTTTAMNTAISTAINDLINGAPGTADTLKEISDLIAENDDAIDLLNSAIGNKADKSVVEALQTTLNTIKTTVDGLGTLATKNIVSYSDLDSSLKNKIDNASASSHSHSNKTVLDGIKSTDITNWDGKSKIHYSATEPQNLSENDMWVKLIN